MNLALLLLIPALAADSSDWTHVQSLHRGARIGVIQSDMKRVEGRFEGATATSITIDGAAVPKDNVMRVYQRARVNRLARTLIGAGAGLAGGAIVNATASERFRNEGSDITAGAIGGGVAIGAGIGALSGGGYHTVYRK